MSDYRRSPAISARQIHSFDDARRLARRRLPWMVFDYIDGAAGSEEGEALNRQALRDIRLRPRILKNVEQRDLSVSLFGESAKAPFGISPMGMCNLAWPGADRMLARRAARDKVPHGVSTVASTGLETLFEMSEGQAWFQLYFSGDGSGTTRLVERAKQAGYQTLVVTVDVPEVGRRPRELRRGFTMPFRIGPSQFIDFALHTRWSLTSLARGRPEMANFTAPGWHFDRTETRARADWDFFRRLRDQWPGKLVVKGVLDIGDGQRLVQEGADAIQVSSHGGRQLDSAPPPIAVLPGMRAALGPDFPIFFDSGIRSGEDIVKAYALGADFVFLGRALLYAIAAGQEAGLSRLWDIYSGEISLTLAQLGLTRMPGRDDQVIWQA